METVWRAKRGVATHKSVDDVICMEIFYDFEMKKAIFISRKKTENVFG
jgi:hypothetical protein